MIQAQLADGTVLEFPDGTDPAVIDRTVKNLLSQTPTQELRRPSEEVEGARNLSRLRTDEGGGFLARAGASIKMTPEGRVSFLESIFGPGNVFTLQDGQIIFRHPGEKDFRLFDEEGFSVKDITADITGEAIEVAPTIAAGTNPLAVGAAGVAGNLARQGVSALLPGEDQLSLGERVLSAGVSGVTAGGSQAVSNLLFSSVRELKNLATRPVRKAAETPFARKGLRLEAETGIPFTLGEFTGSRSQLMIESLGRRTPAAADEFFEFGQKQLRVARDKLQAALDRIDPKAMGRFETGKATQDAFQNAVDTARTARRVQAAADFGVVHELSGGAKIFAPVNLLSEIQKIVDDFDIPGAGDAAQRIVNSAKKTLATIGQGQEGTVKNTLTAEQVNRLLQIYTDAQRGTGVLFKDMDKAQSMLLAGRLKDALLKDLDDMADIGAGPIVDALKIARNRYRENSKILGELKDSVIGRIVGGNQPPERIADAIVRMEPSQIRETISLLSRGDPAIGDAFRRRLVESAFEKAEQAATQQASKRTGQGIKWSATDFIKNLPDIERLIAAGFRREDIMEIGKISKALQRVVDKEFQGSPTAFAGISWDVVRGVFTLSPIQMVRGAAAVLTPRMIARASLTPQGRQAILTLAQEGPAVTATKKGLAALSYFSVLKSLDDEDDVRPLE